MVKSKRDVLDPQPNSSNMDEQQRNIVVDFITLHEKSKRSFYQLRAIPQNRNREWQAYFTRTFDIFTKLWKFQQQHRSVLDAKYGLKRWQIGEIASRIGQLYYNYYLRTSQAYYLSEAYSFYAAIRGRAYYSRASKEDNPGLMAKKLRYYARFIVVALLMKKIKLVKELLAELEAQVVDYTSTYEPEDQLEWVIVCDEIKALIKADSIVTVFLPDSSPVVLSHRLTPLTTPPVEKTPMMNLNLVEVVIFGIVQDQVKFNEITIDMFRMLQTLEREPLDEIGHFYDFSPAPTQNCFDKSLSISNNKVIVNGDRPVRRENPHKHLLYKPTVETILEKLVSGCLQELPDNGAILLYFSADGYYPPSKNHSDVPVPGYDSGLLCSSSKELIDGMCKVGLQHTFINAHCLYPGDLAFVLRKPTFIIVDSDNSLAFSHMASAFGTPLIVMMSPHDTPPAFQEHRNQGSLFTLFLHSPLTAFCLITNVFKVPTHHWERCQSFIDRFVTEASRLLTRSSKIDPAFISFFGDDFLRLIILRYIFCHVVLTHHREFKGRQYQPQISPPMPEAELIEHPSLVHLVLDLSAHLEVRSHFFEPHELTIT